MSNLPAPIHRDQYPGISGPVGLWADEMIPRVSSLPHLTRGAHQTHGIVGDDEEVVIYHLSRWSCGRTKERDDSTYIYCGDVVCRGWRGFRAHPGWPCVECGRPTRITASIDS